MQFTGFNWLAVIVAAVACFGFGAIYYGVLSKQWERAVGRPFSASPLPFIISFAGLVVMAFVMAGLLGHLGDLSLRSGLISGAIVWAGFVLTTLAINNAYQGKRASLTLLDAGHWFGVLVIMGGIIGWFGV